MKTQLYTPKTKTSVILSLVGIIMVILSILVGFGGEIFFGTSSQFNIILLIMSVPFTIGILFILIAITSYLYFLVRYRNSASELLEWGALSTLYQTEDEREELIKYKAGYKAFIVVMLLMPLIVAISYLAGASDYRLAGPLIITSGFLGVIIFRRYLTKHGIELSKRNKKKGKK